MNFLFRITEGFRWIKKKYSNKRKKYYEKINLWENFYENESKIYIFKGNMSTELYINIFVK